MHVSCQAAPLGNTKDSILNKTKSQEEAEFKYTLFKTKTLQ